MAARKTNRTTKAARKGAPAGKLELLRKPALGAVDQIVKQGTELQAKGVTLAPAVAGRSELQLFGSYHVSQQNTFTGKLTPAMLEEVLSVAANAAGLR